MHNNRPKIQIMIWTRNETGALDQSERGRVIARQRPQDVATELAS